MVIQVDVGRLMEKIEYLCLEYFEIHALRYCDLQVFVICNWFDANIMSFPRNACIFLFMFDQRIFYVSHEQTLGALIENSCMKTCYTTNQ